MIPIDLTDSTKAYLIFMTGITEEDFRHLIDRATEDMKSHGINNFPPMAFVGLPEGATMQAVTFTGYAMLKRTLDAMVEQAKAATNDDEMEA